MTNPLDDETVGEAGEPRRVIKEMLARATGDQDPEEERLYSIFTRANTRISELKEALSILSTVAHTHTRDRILLPDSLKLLQGIYDSLGDEVRELEKIIDRLAKEKDKVTLVEVHPREDGHEGG